MKFLILVLCTSAANAIALPPGYFIDLFTGQGGLTSVQPVKTIYEETQPESEIITGYTKKDADASIMDSENAANPNRFNYMYKTENGISAKAIGQLKKVNGVKVMTVSGQYEYPSTNGKRAMITYIADENGYQPQGDILPTPPPMPAAISRLLVYLALHVKPTETSNKI